MKNITVTVSDETYQRARVCAARRGTSVSALVAEFLAGISDSDSEFQRLAALQQAVFAEISEFNGADRLSRDEVHNRAVR